MVSYNLEITWYNEQARTELFGHFDYLPDEIKDRNVLTYLLQGQPGKILANHEALLQFYLLLYKGRFSRNDLTVQLKNQYFSTSFPESESQSKLQSGGSPVQIPLHLQSENGEIIRYSLYTSFYREGILIVYHPEDTESDSLLGLLERRDDVIHNLLKSIPSLK